MEENQVNWFNYSVEKTAKELNTDVEKGLTDGEVKSRYEKVWKESITG